MKNKRIMNAYDSINPNPADKQRMLDAILAEAKLEEAPHKEKKIKEPIVYTKKQSAKSNMGSVFGTLAAAIVLVIVAGFGFSYLKNFQHLDNTTAEPTAESLLTEKTCVDHYAPVLEKYRRAIDDGWTKEQCEMEGISLRMQAGRDFTKTGYAFLDLDGDGREELLIAEESVPHIDTIWDLYTTLEDGTPIQLWVDEQDGNQCYLYEGNIIGTEYTTKTEAEYTFYTMESGQLVMQESLLYEDEDTVFYTDAEGNTHSVTSKEAMDISYRYEHQKLSLTWLTDTASFQQNTDSAERYTPILEKYKTALTENWTWEQCDAADISRQILFNTTNKNDLGWCIMDIDDNGADELIISDGTYLFDLYTLIPTDGKPGHLLSAHPNHYTLCKDGTIECREHENVINIYWHWFELSGMDLVRQEVVFYEGEKHQYSYGEDIMHLKVVSENEAGSYLTNPEKSAMALKLIPFLDKQFPEIREPNFYYEPIIEKHRQAIRENWNPGQCMENGISLMIGYYGELYDNLGHNQYDLNGDGNDELIITDGNNIYDLYTIVSDETVGPLRLIDATERQQYFMTTDGHIYAMGSGGAMLSYHTLYTLGQRDLVLQKGYVMDANENAKNPWFYYDGANKGDPCPTAEAAAAIDAIRFAEISFIPFE